MTQPLALTLGDPAGVGPIIATRAWEQRDQLKRPFFLVGDVDQIRRAGGDATEIKSPNEAETVFERSIPVFHIPCSPTDAGRPNPETAPAIISWIETAVARVNAGEAAAVVTNPINKALLYDQGFDFPGHTEFLAHLLQGDAAALQRPVMMLVGGGLRVALATIHMPLAGAAKRISRDLLVEIGQIVATDLRQNFGVGAPRLAFAGLNPHAG
ncbi:MAG: 4-hydroxythreonine-4-phosphate dehydrogenase PdxA, partial [Pseudomonadota bacterium]